MTRTKYGQQPQRIPLFSISWYSELQVFIQLMGEERLEQGICFKGVSCRTVF